MSTILDPAKLKVVELRAELSARGLDTKGNKPVLVKRLKDALEEEIQQGKLYLHVFGCKCNAIIYKCANFLHHLTR